MRQPSQFAALFLGLCSFLLAELFAPTLYVHAYGPPQGALSVPAHPENPADRQLTVRGLTQFVQVTPNLFRGGQPTDQGFEALAGMGIGIVVDLRGARKREHDLVTKLGMKYVAIPWHCPFPKDKVFAEFLTLIRQNPEKKVFVHCRLGDDRVGMMIAAYRMAEQGWTAEEAKKEMRASGFTTSHHLICPGLSGYEATFPQRYKTSPAFQDLRAGAKAAD